MSDTLPWPEEASAAGLDPDSISALAPPAAAAPAWAAVGSMTLGVFGLVTAEFLPASLLTPMAADLRISEGTAGQAVTATAIVALVASLLVATVTRRIDRRVVLLVFTVLLIVSNLIVAFAPDLGSLLVGRVLLGIALGGFWAMSAALAMRLVPEEMVPRALSIIFSGVSAATIFAAPVGSYLGHLFGWRAVFLIAAVLAVATLIAQVATLPRMAPSGSASLRTLVDVLRRPGIGIGMLAAMLVFSGHFAVFTYIRPFLETVTGVGISAVSGILLGFGVANFVGTLVAGRLLQRSLGFSLVCAPVLMGVLGLGLVTLANNPAGDALMVALWGFAFGIVPVAWSTWLTRTVPDQAESAGGLLVAAVQFAISVGAAGGGMIFDRAGATGVFGAASLILLVSVMIILAGVRPRLRQGA
ncbi:MFS transporter [Ancylobacter amanitiformis]|uniref:MFS family arabinose efflux permease n=1 Tax=Ancylobacter amanitiformis TaxID=217069 RepID=A0ABU0LRG8_9HYPH|nr:MFS transporter [Ancylobacter amanitiformis]MDQ0511284.1 putative MFS family arabinose efflux permease [Ancylobacter amanitiformis]